MKKLLCLLLFAGILSSCISAHKIYPKPDRNYKLPASYTKQKVYVIKPDSLDYEFKILNHSNLFEFTEDSLYPTQIKLYAIERHIYPCGNPMLGSLLTFGLLPSQLPDQFTYKFDVIDNDTVTPKIFELKIARSLWILNLFSSKKNFKKQAGIAIRAKALK